MLNDSSLQTPQFFGQNIVVIDIEKDGYLHWSDAKQTSLSRNSHIKLASIPQTLLFFVDNKLEVANGISLAMLWNISTLIYIPTVHPVTK